jgi:hypothetical protein
MKIEKKQAKKHFKNHTQHDFIDYYVVEILCNFIIISFISIKISYNFLKHHTCSFIILF